MNLPSKMPQLHAPKYVILGSMTAIRVFDDTQQLAVATAEAAADCLRSSIGSYGNATWVLAGGSAPLAAYTVLASSHKDSLDWTKVTLLLGDERIADPKGKYNNWQPIARALGQLPAQMLPPRADLSAEESAADYTAKLRELPQAGNGLPRLDLVWLGVGEDGHTLSLFPGHSSLFPSGDLVIPVHDSPKPPSDRISLSLRALQGTQHAMVLTSGAAKQAAVQGALAGNHSPIALATSIIDTHEGIVQWFVDKSAAPH